MIRALSKTALAAIACLSLAACEDGAVDKEDSKPVYAVATPTAAQTWNDGEVPAGLFTTLLVQLAWQQSEDKRLELCESLFLGPEFTTALLQVFTEGQDTRNIDWDYAVELVAERCAREGH